MPSPRKVSRKVSTYVRPWVFEVLQREAAERGESLSGLVASVVERAALKLARSTRDDADPEKKDTPKPVSTSPEVPSAPSQE